MTPTPAAPSGELLPCPFCGGAARIESNRDWHKLYANHDDDCAFDADDHDLMYPAQPGYLKEIVEVWNRRALAAPSGAPKQPNDDYDQLDAMREAVSDFRKAAYEFGKRHDPADQVTMMEAQRRIFTEARNLAAASTVQSAPVLPDASLNEREAFEKDASAWGMPLDGHGGHYSNIRTRNRWLGWQARAAQSTPVQVEGARCQHGVWASDHCYQCEALQLDGQQDSQAHVMPPFAAPAGQHDAFFAAPAGYKLVPQMATLDMRNAAVRAADKRDTFMSTNDASVVWAAMLAAAPEQSGLAGAAKGGIGEPNGAVQATPLDVVLHDIELERKRQDDQWGGAAHDDKHTTKEFAQFIYNQISRIGDWTIPERISFLKAAALAVAAVEMLDRKSEPTTAVQALALPVAAAPDNQQEQK